MIKDKLTGMCMLPSTGESVYSTTLTTYTDNSGFSKVQNQNVEDSETSDFVIALNNLKRDVPQTKWVSLIVSWFGTDLRADFCKILPKTEHKEGASIPSDWIVSDYNRANGKVPNYFDSSFYDGSYYADAAVTLTPNFAEGVRGEMTTVRVQHIDTSFNKFATDFPVQPNTDYVIKYSVKALNVDNQTVRARVEGGTGFVELLATNYTAKLNEWTRVEFNFNSGIHTQIDLQMSIGDSWLDAPIVSDILIDVDSIFISEDNASTFEGLAYGGTPSDNSIIEGIQELKRQGYKVLFYPFILMDIKAGNGLPSPTGEFEQPIFPWRGRISVMDGLDNTPFVDTAVANFFGDCEISDFEIVGDTVQYNGTPQDSYRKMILHYANLCVIAGGVDAFAVGTEMRGLTWLRSARTTFPAVEEFTRLLNDCRSIMGADVELTYAADWTEVTPYQPQDGSNDLLHHLDSLWMNPNCDFIGIDNYIPLSDWRDGDDHLDAQEWDSIYNVDYLKSQIEGGELYDYFYANENNRVNQIRTPIIDWNYKVKDNKNWWLNDHFNRLAFEFPGTQTTWIPQSKRIVYTEFGCSAIDKGTNEPNKFLDPKSSESTAPRYSNGERDDLIQEKYYEAFLEYWNDPNNNPISNNYSGEMIDTSMMFAWTWDGRPYPEFPNKLNVWSDGVNYEKGHWLMGREFILEEFFDADNNVLAIYELVGLGNGRYGVNGLPITRDNLLKIYDDTPIVAGVESVTGDGVDNTDPKNPIINIPDTNPAGLEGQIYKIVSDNTNDITPQDNVLVGNYIVNDEQLSDSQGSGGVFISFEEVFNTWKRFSHGSTGSLHTDLTNIIPANPPQTNSFSYNPLSDTISSTINSPSLIGFISNQRLSQYTHRLTVTSAATDNDHICAVIAYVEDENDLVPNNAFGLNQSTYPSLNVTDEFIPNQHTLTLVRGRTNQTNHGVGPINIYYAIVYNYRKLDQKVIALGNDLVWITNSHWSGNSVDLEIVRNGDDITVRTSEFSDSPDGKGTLRFPLSINLNSDPDLLKFKGPASYGYGAFSQDGLTFSDIELEGSGLNEIYDIRNGDVWIADSLGNWSLDVTRKLYDIILDRTILFNPRYRNLIWYEDRDNFNILSQPFILNLTEDEVDAIKNANNPSETNPFATIEDLEDVDVITSFSNLTDTPEDYVGQGGKFVVVKGDEDGLEFIDSPSGGGLKIVPFSTIIDASGNFRSVHTQTEPIAYTRVNPTPMENFGNKTIHFIYPNGSGGKPTFSGNFIVQYDNWSNDLGAENMLTFVASPSGNILVWLEQTQD